MRQGILVWYLLLLFLVIPAATEAQTRLFQPGDSGVITTLDFLLISEDYHGNTFGVLRGSYTHNGLWDLGVEFGDVDLNSYKRHGIAFFGNYAILNPLPGDRWGLEARLRYSNNVSDQHLPPVRGYFIPEYDRVRHRSIIPGLRGFYRNAEASQIIGLGVSYRFRKYEVLAPDDEVLIGYDYDEPVFDFDVHSRVWGAMHLSLEMTYSQYKYQSGDRWELYTVFSVGVMFGRQSDEGSNAHE